MNTMPFVVSRQNKASLIEQVADGLRGAITTGHFHPGDKLPNLHAMAAALEVSEFVTRRAVQRLTREGLLTARRSFGTVVCGTDQKTWRGHVLCVNWSGAGMYYDSVRSAEVTERLHAANVLVSTLFVNGADFENGFVKVQAELGHAISLAVVNGPVEKLDALLAEHDIPFIHIGGAISPRAVQGIAMRADSVLPALRDHCLACGVRSVLQVAPGQGAQLDAAPVLAAAGITVENLPCERVAGLDSPEAVHRGALQTLRRWLEARPKLPDLLWFADDFVAQGALLALALRGIRIPEDVQVISWANKGLGPVFDKPLTRVEMDPKAHGAVVAQCILNRLDGHTNGHGPVELTPTFIEGATTRKK
jgi:DNA-binding LacI/PurR family transcriptional regulator